jgi:hypothetical protein
MLESRALRARREFESLLKKHRLRQTIGDHSFRGEDFPDNLETEAKDQ